MSDSIDNNQQQNLALLNLTSAEGNENQFTSPDQPVQGEIIEENCNLSTSTNSLQQQNASLLRDKKSDSKEDIEITIEQDAKVICY